MNSPGAKRFMDLTCSCSAAAPCALVMRGREGTRSAATLLLPAWGALLLPAWGALLLPAWGALLLPAWGALLLPAWGVLLLLLGSAWPPGVEGPCVGFRVCAAC